MKIKLLLICFLFVSVVSLRAQLSDYYSLKDVKKYRFDKLGLKDETEASKFIHHAAEFNFISGLKVEGNIPLADVLNRTGGFYDLNELNLKNYTGDYHDNDFDSCSEIEVLHLSVAENKLGQLSCLSHLKKLNTLYLYVVGKPESMAALIMIPNIREIHVIGEFLPQHVAQTILAVGKNPRLNVFGISLDRITDLSPDVVKLRYMSDLIIYDNHSVYSNNGIEDLTEEKLTLTFNIYSDLAGAVNVHYLSANDLLAGFETAYLEKLYAGHVLEEKADPMAAEETESTEKFFKPFQPEFKPNFAQPVEFRYPYPSLKPDEEIFRIDPAKDAVITCNSGLRLIIAHNSFVNQSGENVTDPVYIRISEITTSGELLFSGVGLNAGNRQYYNSRYMINVQATTSRSEVTLKTDYQMKAILPVGKDSSVEYFFDYESNSWQDLNYYNSVFSSTLEPIDFYKIENQNAAVRYVMFDTSTFNTRYAKQANFFLNDRNNDNQILFMKQHLYTDPDRTWIKSYNKSGDRKGIRVKRGKSMVKLLKVTPKKRNRERQYFKVMDKTEQQIFTELKAFRNINFSVKVNPEDKRELTEQFIRNYKYQDVRIDYKPGQMSCVITLKYQDGYKVLTAFITDSENDKTLKKDVLRFTKAYKKYLHALNTRAGSFNENNAVRYDEFKQFLENKVKENERNKMATEVKLNQLGTFSLFEIKPVDFSTNLIVQYTDETGLPLDIKDLYMIDSRYQTILKPDLKNIAINPSTCQLIFATDYNGEMYFANKNDILGMNLANNSLTYIKLNKVKVKLNSIEAFNNYIK